jgi:hypothetical protein
MSDSVAKVGEFFAEAARIVEAHREGARGDIWLNCGARGHAVLLKAKMERVFRAVMLPAGDWRTVAQEEALDIANYAAFLYLCARLGTLDGRWDWHIGEDVK